MEHERRRYGDLITLIRLYYHRQWTHVHFVISMQTSNVENNLIDRAVNGDDAALAVLLTKTYGRLRDRLDRRVPARFRGLFDAEDIVQETHIEVFRRIHEFDQRQEGSFDRWIALIALHRLRNFIRAQHTLKRGGQNEILGNHRQRIEDSAIALLDTLVGSGRTPSRSMARNEAVGALQAALATLPEHYRQAIWMIHIQGTPISEAASELGRTEAAVRGLCRRGLGMLRNRLDSAFCVLTSIG